MCAHVEILARIPAGNSMNTILVGGSAASSAAILQGAGTRWLPPGDVRQLERGRERTVKWRPLERGDLRPGRRAAGRGKICSEKTSGARGDRAVRLLTRAYPRSMASLSFAAQYMRQ
jgi:hypothetical protein